jgi:acyl-CoA dehydrogenase
MWDFETEPQFQAELDWVTAFVKDEVKPLDHIVDDPYDLRSPLRNELIRPLQQTVRDRGLWACHLGADLGGRGYGQVKLALLNERLGIANCGPIVFGAQAPDSGNAEILAHYGSAEQKTTYLEPLLNNDIVSAFSMTELQAGSDPREFRVTAVPDGDDWLINGDKWFTTNAKHASFLIVMAVTDPDASAYRRQSMFVVPAETPGVEILRDVRSGMSETTHSYVRYANVRVPAASLLGERGEGFVVAQTRLGGGRVHHAMRSVGLVSYCLDMMAERALSRTIGGRELGNKQLIQEMIADSWGELEMFRLLVLRTAWRIDKYQDYRKVRGDIAAVKMITPTVLRNVASRALQVHGSLGVSEEMPFGDFILRSHVLGLADGPTEVHKVTVAKEALAGHTASEDEFPTQHLPRLRRAAELKYADVLARHSAATV